MATPPAVAVGAQIAARLHAAGHVSAEGLARAERVHAKVKNSRTLCSVLLELRLVTEEQIR